MLLADALDRNQNAYQTLLDPISLFHKEEKI
jgi:hypothetical protein